MLLLLLMATKLLVIIILVHPRTYTLFVAPFARGGGRKEMQERIKVRMRERRVLGKLILRLFCKVIFQING